MRTKIGRQLIRIMIVLAAGAAGWGVGQLATTPAPTPYCPEEDSCWVDYSDGRWTVHEEHVDDAPAWVRER